MSLRSIHKLQEALAACSGTDGLRHPRKYKTSLVNLATAADGALQHCHTADARAFPEDVAEALGQVPTAVVGLLERMLGVNPRGPALQLPGEGEAASALCRFINDYGIVCTKNGRLPLLLRSLAAAQPCRALATALHVTESATPPPTLQADRLLRFELGESAISAAFGILRLAQKSCEFGSDVAGTQLVTVACVASATLPHLSSAATALAASFFVVLKDAGQLQPSAVAGAAGELSESALPLSPAATAAGSGRPDMVTFTALAKEPAFACMLINAAATACDSPAGDTASRMHFGCVVLPALFAWLHVNRHPAAGGPRPFSVGAHVVRRVLQAICDSGDWRFMENRTVGLLFLRLATHAERQRCFPDVVAHAQRALDRALLTGLPTASLAYSTGPQGASAFVHSAIGFLPSLFHARFDDLVSPGPVLLGLTSRARWVVQRGVLGKCEALLRLRARRGVGWEQVPPLWADAAPGLCEMQCAAIVASLLLDDATHGAAAIAVLLSMLGTLRKVLVVWDGTTTAAAAAAAAAAAGVMPLPQGLGKAAGSPSGGGGGAGGSGGGSARSDCAGSGNGGSSSSSSSSSRGGDCGNDGSGGSGGGGGSGGNSRRFPDSPLSTAVRAFDQLLRHPLFRLRHAAGSPAATAVLLYMTAQLLPLLMRLALRHLRGQPPSGLDGGMWLQLTQLLTTLHGMGISRLTAAAGAPAMLCQLLRSLHVAAAAATVPRDAASGSGSGSGSSAAADSRRNTATGGRGGGGCGSSGGGDRSSSGSHPAGDDSLALLVAAAAAQAIQSAAGDMTWLAAAARLSLVEDLAACVAVADPDAASRADVDTCLDMVLGGRHWLTPQVQHQYSHVWRRRLLAASLDQAVSDLLLTVEERSPTPLKWLDGSGETLLEGMDRCVVASAAMLCTKMEACAKATSVPLLGCCHRGCTNLAGDSDAGMPSKRCGGCNLTRYCSERCQRRAWRSGHRAVCIKWMTGEPAAPVGALRRGPAAAGAPA